jgi:hypothetical protein
MSEVTTKPQQARYNRYNFAELKPGDSHYLHKGIYKRVYEAWRSYLRLHPECLSWDVAVAESANGVIYRRLK